MALNAGAGASIDMAQVMQAKNVFASYLFNTLKNVEMPDMAFDSGFLNQNVFRATPSLNASDTKIVVDEANNGIQISAKNMNAQFLSKSMVERLNVLDAKGSAYFDMTSVSISLDMGITTQKVGERLLPAFKTSNIKVDLPDKNMTL